MQEWFNLVRLQHLLPLESGPNAALVSEEVPGVALADLGLD